MNKDQEYRRLAAEAQELAERAKNANDRAAWLRIARSWLGLIQKPTSVDAFEQAVDAQGTQQELSSSSH